MDVHQVDPLHDRRWQDFLARHPRASVFHTPGWLGALRLTYGYQPFVLTTSAPGHELTNGLLVCRVDSRLTGRRLVSVPFSDHCEPLFDRGEDLRCVLEALHEEADACGCKYFELRPASFDLEGFPHLSKSMSFYLHRLDLQPCLEDLFRNFHGDCVRRKIRRAEREGLSYEEGRSEPLLEKFYRLLILTRRRQSTLPPPVTWFRNLIACLGDKLKIRLASNKGQPTAGILTLNCKTTLVYKYGCSDRQYSNLGGTQMLFWKAIQEAKLDGLRELDMGRSDWDDLGLITFKDRWGAARSILTYRRYGTLAGEFATVRQNSQLVRRILERLPESLLAGAGSLLYRHAG